MKVYVDTSVVLRRVLNEPGALENWPEWDLAVSSELLQVEARRGIDRLRVLGKLNSADAAERLSALHYLLASFEQVPIRRPILDRAASPFPTPLGTLDAIHLMTALVWIEENGEPLTFLTHDAELALAARASGLDVKTAP
jgi:predicted nucleic acid-binding protein